MKKSVLILGLFLCASEAIAKSSNVGSSSGPRFQVIQLSDMRRDQILIDSQTGQLWTKLCLNPTAEVGECDYAPWVKSDVEGINMSIKDIYKKSDAVKEFNEKQKDKSGDSK